jgi:tol-pal system protein YbgF
MRMLLTSALRRVALPFALAAAFIPAAHAGFFDDDEARKAILDLRQRIDQSSDQNRARQVEQTAALNEQISQLKRSLLDLNSQLELMRAELAKMRGTDEQLARDVSELQRKATDISQGVEDRIRKLEPQKVSVDGKEFMADVDEKRAYDDAIAVFRKGEFAPAAAALSSFLRRYPTSGYGDSATFWLGNAQYGMRDYKEAIVSFRNMLKSAPEHPRAAEAMLSIANCQAELKDTKSARRTIEELTKTYPRSEAAQAGRDRLASLR